MTLLGSAALAMWWDIAPAVRAQFEDWHSHEHFPERMNLPGFLRGSRWSSVENDEGFFVLYELATYETLTSPAYRERLNHPSAWSLEMMPQHRNMVRSQCRVLESAGNATAGFIATLRLTPQPGQEETLRSRLHPELARLATLPGIAGAHLLRTDTPAAAQTEEQRLRGGKDAAGDWILLAAGYDPALLRACAEERLGAGRLEALGALPGAWSAQFRLCHSAAASDYPPPASPAA